MGKTHKDSDIPKNVETTKKGGVEYNKESPEHDVRAESKRTGKVTTDRGLTTPATSPAIPHGQELDPPEEAMGFNSKEQEDLVGELGEEDREGYLPTDAEGNVTGPAVIDRDAAGEWAVKVELAREGDHLITPSGAPIMKRMNPDSKLEDNTLEATEAQNTKK